MSNSERLGELRRDVKDLQRAIVLLSKVTPNKTGSSYDDWEAFVKAIKVIEERVEDIEREGTGPHKLYQPSDVPRCGG